MRRLFFLTALFLAACAPVQVAVPPETATPIAVVPPTFAPPTVAPTSPPAATATAELTNASYIDLDNDGKTVVYDFTEHLCEARWTNNTDPKGLPCPGDLNNIGKGYIGLLSGSDIGLDAGLPMLLAFPAYDNVYGLFGRYPKFTVGANDEFRVSLACRSNSKCFISFAIGYYDSNGKYQEPFPTEYYRPDVEPPLTYVWPLGSLAGQTVEFSLAIRAEDFPAEAWALLIQPRILR
ncbi:MAG: hypothetical protein HFACDABA_01154 [Anaerolineales bacterium]|nr:hypothetical protein [Anaerolineales bacterium]